MTIAQDTDTNQRSPASPRVPALESTAGRTWRDHVARIAAVVRRIVGVPDYAVYLEHMSRQHPECTPLDARSFERERQADRYNRPGSRCC